MIFHGNIGFTAEVLDDDLLQVPVGIVQVAEGDTLTASCADCPGAPSVVALVSRALALTVLSHQLSSESCHDDDSEAAVSDFTPSFRAFSTRASSRRSPSRSATPRTSRPLFGSLLATLVGGGSSRTLGVEGLETHMKITVVGGWSDVDQDNKNWDLDVTDQRTFVAACEAIGNRLAKKRHTVVVGSAKDNSADPHVVRGFLTEFENQEAPEGLIHLIAGIHGEGKLYREERESEKYRKLFTGSPSLFSGQRPRAAEKILSTREADALITIGGLNDTYLAGVTAILAQKPVLPFASWLDAPLYFFNANVGRTQILAQTSSDSPPQAILLDLAASADLDIGTTDMLRDLYSDLRAKQIDLLFAQVRGSVHDRMQKSGLLEHVGEDHLYPSIAAAVAAFQARPASGEGAAASAAELAEDQPLGTMT